VSLTAGENTTFSTMSKYTVTKVCPELGDYFIANEIHNVYYAYKEYSNK